VPRKARAPTTKSTTIIPKPCEPFALNFAEHPGDCEHLNTNLTDPGMLIDISAGGGFLKTSEDLKGVDHQLFISGSLHSSSLSEVVSTSSMISIDDVLFHWSDLSSSC
jgi:hypothetical protein